MKIKLLSIIGMSAAMTAASAFAQTVLFNEDWSGGLSDWTIVTGQARMFEIKSHPVESGKNVLAGVKGVSTDNVLAYAALTNGIDVSGVDLTKGISMDFTFNRVDGVQYTRIGFGTGEGDNATINSYYLDFGVSGVTLAKLGMGDGGNKVSNISYIGSPVTPNPTSGFVTYSLQMIQVAEGLQVVLKHGDEVKVAWLDENPHDFSDLLFPYIGFRIHTDGVVGDNAYISDITLQEIPEPSHVAMLIGAVGLMVFFARRRSR